jgi:hypothetical protein
MAYSTKNLHVIWEVPVLRYAYIYFSNLYKEMQ